MVVEYEKNIILRANPNTTPRIWVLRNATLWAESKSDMYSSWNVGSRPRLATVRMLPTASTAS
jgi:hypothetical protein